MRSVVAGAGTVTIAIGGGGIAPFLTGRCNSTLIVVPAGRDGGFRKAVEVLLPREGGDGLACSGKASYTAPFALAVATAANRAHFHRVGGGGVQPRKRERILIRVNGVRLITVEADLPSGSITDFVPAHYRTIARDGIKVNNNRCRAGHVGGEAYGVAPFAHLAAITLALYPHLVFGFRIETGEAGRCGGRIEGLPSAGRNGDAASHIVNMQVVVSIACSRFAVEGDTHRLTGIDAQINADRLACGGVGDVVVNVGRSVVVPFAQDAPIGLVVGGDQHDKSVIDTCRSRSRNIDPRVCGQGKVEVQGEAILHINGRGDEPIFCACPPNIESCMAIEYSIAAAQTPAASIGQCGSVHHLAQQPGLSFPTIRKYCRGKFLIKAIDILFRSVVDRITVGIFTEANPSHIGGMTGDVGDARFSKDWFGAGSCGSEVYLVAPFAGAVAVAVGTHLHGVVSLHHKAFQHIDDGVA